MRNFQSFTLAMMMMTMATVVMMTGTACAAPTTVASAHLRDIKKEMLKKMIQEATKLKEDLSQTNQRDIFVHYPKGNGTICVAEFFCCAENSLKELKDGVHAETETLRHQMHHYNKEFNITCHQESRHQIRLTKLLDNIIHCSKQITH